LTSATTEKKESDVAEQPYPNVTDTQGQAEAVTEPLGEAECLRLLAAGGVGRIGYSGRFGPTILPVNFALHGQTIVFRTGQHSPMGDDLRTGIADAAYKVAFEVDEISPATREGWSILVQGAAHHVDSEAELAAVRQTGVQPWPGGDKDLFIRIVPDRVTGRRISRTGRS
jgi:nitroimidazol reductase NimA-like FMN-containing flavoprotein (pyridoxamine 5'-phosphate oxidase superfamily)